MSSQHHRLPEPSLPENDLIRAADTLPELSSGLRSATLVVCHTHLRRAQRIRQWKMVVITTVAASAAIAVWTLFAISPPETPQPMAQESVAPSPTSGWSSPSKPKTGSAISLGTPGSTNAVGEIEMIDNTIEEIHRRTQKLMDAGMIPGF